MMLISCEIEGFGGLHGVRYEFNPGLNRFYTENGSGKSTFAAFLSAMLFGFSPCAKKEAEDNPRLRFLPWTGGAYGGNLTFSLKGRAYRVVRSFGRKESEDTFQLYFADSNRPSTDFPQKDFGKAVTGLSRSAYEKSVFFSNPDSDIFKEKDPDIVTAASKYMESDVSASSFSEAIRLLEKQKKVYILKGNKGKIGDLQTEIEKAGILLHEGRKKREELASLQSEIKEVDQSLSRLSEKESELKLKTAQYGTASENAAGLESHLAFLRKTASDAEELRKAAEDSFTYGAPDKAVFDKLTHLYEDVLRLGSECDAARLSLSDAALCKRLSQKKNGKNSFRTFLRPLIFGVSCALILFTASWFLPTALLQSIGFSLSLCFLIAGVVLAFVKRKRTAFPPEDKAGLDTLTEKISHFNDVEKQLREKEIVLLSLLRRYGEGADNCRDAFFSLSRRFEKLEFLTSAAEAAKAHVDDYLAKTADSQSALPTDAEMREAEMLIGAEKKRLQGKRLMCERHLAILECEVREAESASSRLPALSKELETAEKRLSAITAAEDFLTRAHDNLSRRCLFAMQTRFTEYLSAFLPDLKEKPLLDSTLTLSLASGASVRSPRLYSDGVRSIFAFCMHLSLADALTSESEPLFYIIDDVFSELDDKNFASVKEFIRKKAETRQILYFTCHSSRRL